MGGTSKVFRVRSELGKQKEMTVAGVKFLTPAVRSELGKQKEEET